MRVRALVLASWLALSAVPLLAPAAAEAQEATAEAQGPQRTATQTDPETGERYRLERPAEAMRRGPWQVPGWVVATGGAVIALAAAAVLAWRALRRRR